MEGLRRERHAANNKSCTCTLSSLCSAARRPALAGATRWESKAAVSADSAAARTAAEAAPARQGRHGSTTCSSSLQSTAQGSFPVVRKEGIGIDRRGPPATAGTARPPLPAACRWQHRVSVGVQKDLTQFNMRQECARAGKAASADRQPSDTALLGVHTEGNTLWSSG